MSFSASFFLFLLVTALSPVLTLLVVSLSPTFLEPGSNFPRPKDALIRVDVRQHNLASVPHDQATIFIFCLAL